MIVVIVFIRGVCVGACIGVGVGADVGVDVGIGVGFCVGARNPSIFPAVSVRRY